MWVSKKKWDNLIKRISALEKAEQERNIKEKRISSNSDLAIEKARALFRMM